MVNLFNHQKRIGIVGTGPDAASFIDQANRLGFYTYQLCRKDEKAKVSSNADQVFVGAITDNQIREEFIMQADLLVYFDYSINSQQLEDTKQAVIIPQGADLLAIARDRVLQNAFKESLSINITPFEIIVKKEDIINAMPSIGYPAFLRTNFNQPDAITDVYFIYEEKDIEKASELLKYGTCVLESWVVAEHQLSISVVKKASGSIQLYPIIEKFYQKDRLSRIEKFVTADQELVEEIQRVAELLAGHIDFIGAITIDLIISPAQALYIGDIHPYPNSLSRYTEGRANNSVIAAHLRAVAGMPLAEVPKEQADFIYLPLYLDQKELIEEWLAIYPDWQFTFYPSVKTTDLATEKEIGHVFIETIDLQQTREYLKKQMI